jgi:hypothetical protein
MDAKIGGDAAAGMVRIGVSEVRETRSTREGIFMTGAHLRLHRRGGNRCWRRIGMRRGNRRWMELA